MAETDVSPADPDPNDVSRFELLYRAHAPAVVAYAARRVPPDGVADVVADTFAVAWRRLDRVPGEPLPWLLGVARRVIANQRRSERRRDRLVSRAAAEPVAAAHAEPDSELAELLAALRSLSDRDREALQLAAWEGLSAPQAARVLGCSPTAYRLRLHRARRKLAARLDRAGDVRPEPFRPHLRPEELP